MSVRLSFAVLPLAALAGGLWWTASLSDGDDAAPGAFQAFVVGPGGAPLANGTVLAPGTPLGVLQALADERGFAVEVEQQPWVGGGCTAAYVAGIAGHRET